jgi:hypothetical protein
MYRQTHRDRGAFDRRFSQNAARGWAIGLRCDADDLNDAALAKAVERLERADRELRRAEEQCALC